MTAFAPSGSGADLGIARPAMTGMKAALRTRGRGEGDEASGSFRARR